MDVEKSKEKKKTTESVSIAAMEQKLYEACSRTGGGNKLLHLGVVVFLLLQELELLVESDLRGCGVLLELAELIRALLDLLVSPLHLHQRLLPQTK
jgi:hypothetical protein